MMQQEKHEQSMSEAASKIIEDLKQLTNSSVSLLSNIHNNKYMRANTKEEINPNKKLKNEDKEYSVFPIQLNPQLHENVDIWNPSDELKEISKRIRKHNDFSFKKACKSMAKLLKEKNRRYGNAALEPLNVFSGKTKVGTRIDDKLARAKFSRTLKKNDVIDLIGYLFLVCKENGWDNFDDLID